MAIAQLIPDEGVFTDGGSTPAGNGDLVQTWNDVTTGSGLSVAQATSSARPTVVTVYPSLSFDGGDLLTGSVALPSELRLYLPVKYTGGAGATKVAFTIGDGGTLSTLWAGVLNGNYAFSGNTESRDITGPVADSDWHLLEGNIRDGVMTLILDGAILGSAPHASYAPNAGFIVGNYPSLAAQWLGSIGEIIVTENADHATRVRLLSTYGITSQTPVLDEWILLTFDHADNGTGRFRVLTGPDGIDFSTEINPTLFPVSSVSSPASAGDYAAIQFLGAIQCFYTRTRDVEADMTSIGFNQSADAIDWAQLPDVDCSEIAGVKKLWAPEPFVEGGTLHLFLSVSTADPYDQAEFTVYRKSTTDLATWTDAVAVAGVGKSYIDPFLIKVGAFYCLWIKNEVSKYIEVFSSSTIDGSFAKILSGDFMGIGFNVEGPTIRLVDGGTKWRFYADPYAAGTGLHYCEQAAGAGDWTDGNSNPWSTFTALDAPFLPRHGTPLRLHAEPPAPSGRASRQFGYSRSYGFRRTARGTTVAYDLTVSGAGETAANGGYFESGTSDGRPKYSKGDYTILWMDGDSSWFLQLDGGTLYQGGDDVAFPWLVSSWTGSPEPAPTVSEG